MAPPPPLTYRPIAYALMLRGEAAPPDQPAVRVVADGADLAVRPIAGHLDVVAKALKLLTDVQRQPPLHYQPLRVGAVRVERAWEVLGVERRRVDRLLEIHPEVDMRST